MKKTRPGIVVSVLAHCLIFLIPVSLELGQARGTPVLRVQLEPDRTAPSPRAPAGGTEESIPVQEPGPAPAQKPQTARVHEEKKTAPAALEPDRPKNDPAERNALPSTSSEPPLEQRETSMSSSANPPAQQEAGPVPSPKIATTVSSELSSGGSPGISPDDARAPEGTGLADATPLDTSFGLPEAPSFLHREIPRYPPLARRRGVEGLVLLRLSIDAAGRVTAVEVIEDPGFGFAAAALAAVERSTFKPAFKDGRPRASHALLPVRFELR